MTRVGNRRWLIWLPLLGVVAWLALFGDKTPASTAALPVLHASKSQRPQDASASGNTLRIKQPESATLQTDAATLASRPPPGRSAKSLEMLVPRDQLILPTQVDKNSGGNLFASGGWTPVPEPVNSLPPPPTAPILPFTFLGKKYEGNAWEVFLARGEESFVVREGSIIENIYRIENIIPPNLNLTYLPLGQRQSLIIGDSR